MRALHRLTTTIATFCLLLLVASCKKEYSLEAGVAGSPATFTLVASGTDCSDAQAAGNYTANTALTEANFVMVTVNVTKTGTWNYNTGTVKGFSFSGSGIFTTTGDQTIMLKASGKPSEAGDIAFPLNIGGGACGFTVTVIDGTAVSDAYYKATIAGVDYFQNVTATNKYQAGFSTSGAGNNMVIGALINYTSSPLPAGLTTFGVSKGLLRGYSTSTEAQFKAFFTPGTYPLAPPGPANLQNGDGIVISWTDKDGNNWSSLHATSAQPASSSFTIISAEDGHDANGVYYVKAKMQFNCVLYKAGTNTIVALTNGEMVGYFGKI